MLHGIRYGFHPFTPCRQSLKRRGKPMNETTNGRPVRKSLAGQLDRLDGIIDTLSEGLNGAVADAVRDAVTAAVQQAIRQVLTEVLTNPDLLRALAGSVP